MTKAATNGHPNIAPYYFRLLYKGDDMRLLRRTC